MVKDLSRRRWIGKAATCLALPASAAWSSQALAGQVEEPLSHSMTTALAAAINEAPAPKPEFSEIAHKLNYLNWLGEMSGRLKTRIPNYDRRIEFLEIVWYESRRAGLETALVLGLIQTESAFRQYAVSVAGALGYMQIMPFWTRLIGDGDLGKLFHAQTNMRYGCVILRHYIDIEKGDLFLALGRYNGSRGKSPYPTSVYKFRERWLHQPEAAKVITASS